MTYNIELDSKSDRNGFTAVMIRLHQTGQKPARIQLNVKFENAKQNWVLFDQKQKAKFRWGRWVFRHEDARQLNSDIENAYTRIKQLVEKWQREELQECPELIQSTLTPKQVAQRYKNRLSECYFDLVAKVLEEAKEGAFRTYSIKRTAVNAFANFAERELTLNRVNASLLERFQKHLKTTVSEKTGKRLKASSINQYMESLAKVHKDVLKLKGHSSRKATLLSPFPDVDALPNKTTYRSKFNESEIETIRTAKTNSNRKRLPPEEAFSVWMLAHFLAGARCSDVLSWRYVNFETDEMGQPVHLKYTMLKTGNVVSIPVFDEARQVLNRWWKDDAKPTDYVLPYLDNSEPYAQYLTREDLYAAPFDHKRMFDARRSYWNGQLNQVLEEIQDGISLKGDLRMHNARHSFADLARRIMETDKTLNPLDITLMLGQTDFRMTMKYMEEMAKQDASKPMRVVFGRKGG